MIRGSRAAASVLCALVALLLPAAVRAAPVPLELVSAPAAGQGGGPAQDACDLSIQCLDFEASADGARAFFSTTERLAATDLDDNKDVYLRSGGATVQVSTGLPGGNGNFDATLQGISSDGARALFASYESLTRDDLDLTSDVYVRDSEVRLVSTGPASSNLQLDVCAPGTPSALACVGLAPAAAGAPVFFTTPESLTFDDLDGGCLSVPESCLDVYQRIGAGTTLVSTGTSGGEGAVLLAASRDGSHVLFSTRTSLTPADTDSALDIYERSGGTVRLVSGGTAAVDVVNDVRISAGGTHVLFATAEPLLAADTGSAVDVYQRAGGATTLVSGGGASDACDTVEGCEWLEISADGARVVFETADALVPEDTDSAIDVYERSSGGLELVSGGGPGGPPAYLDFISTDGTHVVFSTAERLDPADTDGAIDVYERAGGATTLVSAGSQNGNRPLDATAEGTSGGGGRVVFSTVESLVPEDTDKASDLYVRAGGATYLVTGGEFDEGADFLDMSEGGGRVFATAERLAAADVDTMVDVYAADLAGLPAPPEEEPPPAGGGGGGGTGGDTGAAGGGAQAVAPPAGATTQKSASQARIAAAFGRKARATRSGIVSLRVSCGGGSACSGRIVLRSSRPPRALGSKRFGAAAGRTVSVRVKLSKAARRSLGRGRRVKASVTVQTLDPSGKLLSSVVRTLTIDPPARRD